MAFLVIGNCPKVRSGTKYRARDKFPGQNQTAVWNTVGRIIPSGPLTPRAPVIRVSIAAKPYTGLAVEDD